MTRRHVLSRDRTSIPPELILDGSNIVEEARALFDPPIFSPIRRSSLCIASGAIVYVVLVVFPASKCPQGLASAWYLLRPRRQEDRPSPSSFISHGGCACDVPFPSTRTRWSCPWSQSSRASSASSATFPSASLVGSECSPMFLIEVIVLRYLVWWSCCTWRFTDGMLLC